MADEMEVIETNERFVFLVKSRSDPKSRHRVDLTHDRGYGRCSCRDWETRRGPAVKRGDPMGTRSTLCYHLIVARRYFLNDLLRVLSEAE